jgi:hypothetical protein
VQRLASDLSAARSALQLDGSSSPSSVFQSADDIPAYSQKLAAYLALVKGFTAAANADKELQPADASVDATTGGALRQPLVEVGDGAAVAAAGAESRRSALPADCSGCLNFCRWQDALTGQTVYARSARQEYAHVLLAAAILMMTEARDKVDAIVAERLAELSETQLKLAYQQLLHAAGVREACLESMDVAPRAIGAAFADLAQKEEPQTQTEVGGDVGAVPDDDTMAKWREEQRQIQQMTTQQAAPDTTASSRQAKPVASAAAEDLAMLTRVPDLAGGRFPQLQAWIALAEAQELVVLRGVTREVVDFSLMAKLSTDISARYRGAARALSTVHAAGPTNRDLLWMPQNARSWRLDCCRTRPRSQPSGFASTARTKSPTTRPLLCTSKAPRACSRKMPVTACRPWPTSRRRQLCSTRLCPSRRATRPRWRQTSRRRSAWSC